MVLTLDPEVRDALLEICRRECCDMDDLIEETCGLTPEAPLELALCLFAVQYFRLAAGDPTDHVASETRYFC